MAVLVKVSNNYFCIALLFFIHLLLFSCSNQHKWNKQMSDYGPSFRTIEEAVAFEKYLSIHNDSIGTYELFLDGYTNPTDNLDSIDFSQLKNMRSLIIYFAPFESIPKSISHLRKLRNLEIQECPQFNTTKGIEKITTLEKLTFYGTSLSQILDNMLLLKSLKELNWEKNSFPIKLDSSLLFLTNSHLEKVDFSEDKLTEIPVGMKKMKYVRNIYFSDNQIDMLPKNLLKFERADQNNSMVEINLIRNPISEADKKWAKTIFKYSNIYYYFGFEN